MSRSMMPLPRVARAGQVTARPLVLLANVDQVEGLAARLHGAHVVEGHLTDAGPCGVDETKKAGSVFHACG